MAYYRFHLILFKANLKAGVYAKSGEMYFLSWQEELQSHITEGVDTGMRGELRLFLQSVYPNI